jgi:hypothetical protein
MYIFIYRKHIDTCGSNALREGEYVAPKYTQKMLDLLEPSPHSVDALSGSVVWLERPSKVPRNEEATIKIKYSDGRTGGLSPLIFLFLNPCDNITP